jgi:hypothetical protein
MTRFEAKVGTMVRISAINDWNGRTGTVASVPSPYPDDFVWVYFPDPPYGFASWHYAINLQQLTCAETPKERNKRLVSERKRN